MKRLSLVLAFTSAGRLFAQEAGSNDLANPGFQIYLALPMLFVALGTLVLARRAYNPKTHKVLGFKTITPHLPEQFFPIDATVVTMEPVVQALAGKKIHVYSNLSKISLTHKSTGIFLEEKNYKISILINRRRTRRCFLQEGDIIDMGELTLLFSSGQQESFNNLESTAPPESGQSIPRSKRAQTKMIGTYPTLIPADSRKKTFYLTKNIIYIGRSEMNDLVSKAKGISLRHSKIEKVAGRYKILDLERGNGTFVNGRRIETKFLKDGDVVSFESVKYTFSWSGKSR